MSVKPFGIVLAGAAAVMATPVDAGARASASSGVEFSEGRYGTGSRIKTLSAPTTVRVGVGRVDLSASVPYQRVEGPGNVVAGGGGPFGLPILVDPTRPATRQAREGWGDATVAAAYSLPTTAGIDLALTGQMKLPTASKKKALGTGKADYALGAEVAKAFGRVAPFVGVAYTMRGDPEGQELRNGISAHAGAAAQLTASARAIVSYGYGQAASRLATDEHQLTGGLSGQLSKQVGWTAYGSAGLSEGASDLGASVSLRLEL